MGEPGNVAGDQGNAVDPVKSALKASIEANLARERAVSEAVANRVGDAAFFSRGVIFSKSGNGTPFSRGVVFSKSGANEVEKGDPAEIISQVTELDHQSFQNFTDRLLALKQVKDHGGSAGPLAH